MLTISNAAANQRTPRVNLAFMGVCLLVVSQTAAGRPAAGPDSREPLADVAASVGRRGRSIALWAPAAMTERARRRAARATSRRAGPEQFSGRPVRLTASRCGGSRAQVDLPRDGAQRVAAEPEEVARAGDGDFI